MMHTRRLGIFTVVYHLMKLLVVLDVTNHDLMFPTPDELGNARPDTIQTCAKSDIDGHA